MRERGERGEREQREGEHPRDLEMLLLLGVQGGHKITKHSHIQYMGVSETPIFGNVTFEATL